MKVPCSTCRRKIEVDRKDKLAKVATMLCKACFDINLTVPTRDLKKIAIPDELFVKHSDPRKTPACIVRATAPNPSRKKW